MSEYRIKKAKLAGEITIPPSKSHTLRSILFASMASGKSVIHNPLSSPDTIAMINACRAFGAKIDLFADRIEILGLNGKIQCADDVIDAGNSGIVLRFCAAIGALAALPVVLTGDASIKYQRPMKPLIEGLSQLGVSTASMRGDGHAPVIIQGPITRSSTTISGEDSQPVSALLIAAAFADGPIDLHVKNPGEKPWVALTLDWFDRFGIRYENHHFEHYRVFGPSRIEGFEYKVPGDLSTAAFPVAAALVTNSELLLKNVDLTDSQGDKELFAVFQKMGAQFEIDEINHTLRVKKSRPLSGITVDINNFIDALPVLAVVACFAEGETCIHNAAIAKQKECNRIHGISTELKKMGADITETDDGLIIRRSHLKGAQLHSYHDHRIVMSLTVAALGAENETSITPIESVSKTFSTFAHDFNLLGANIKH